MTLNSSIGLQISDAEAARGDRCAIRIEEVGGPPMSEPTCEGRAELAGDPGDDRFVRFGVAE